MLIGEGYDIVMQEMTKHLMLITLQYSRSQEGDVNGIAWALMAT